MYFFCIFAIIFHTLKRIITYIILALVLVSYNYKTINHYLGLTGNIAVFDEDFDCGKKSAESEKSDEGKYKKDSSEYDFLAKSYALILVNQLSFTQQSMLLYAGTDYSLGVYSPPDTPITS